MTNLIYCNPMKNIVYGIFAIGLMAVLSILHVIYNIKPSTGRAKAPVEIVVNFGNELHEINYNVK